MFALPQGDDWYNVVYYGCLFKYFECASAAALINNNRQYNYLHLR